MIKFRCARCGQKIAVNDEGVGAVIACTTCMENIIVPPQSIAEPVTVALAPVIERDWQCRLQVAEERANAATALLRAGLLPHLARMMMNKLVQALVYQRGQLTQTQEVATDRIVDLEQRVIKIQEQLHKRLAESQERIHDLEAENRELKRNNLLMAQYLMDAERERDEAEARLNLRDIDFLLRA